MLPEQRDFFHWLSALIALPAAAYAGQPFFPLGVSGVARRRRQHGRADRHRCHPGAWHVGGRDHQTTPNMLISMPPSCWLTFLLVGRYLDQNMRRKTRAVAGNLAALKAETAAKFVGADEIPKSRCAAIHPGDIVLLRPGERCAVDGTVIEGRSEIDQSLITGETLYVRGRAGHRGLCRFAEHFRYLAGAGGRGLRSHAVVGDHPASGQRVAGAPRVTCISLKRE